MATRPIFVVDNGAYMSKSMMNSMDSARWEMIVCFVSVAVVQLEREYVFL